MVSNLATYYGEFVNTETTRPANANIQQLFSLYIIDTESEVIDNPFGFFFIVQGSNVRVGYTSSPGGAHTKYFGYSSDDGASWTDIEIGANPAILSIPPGDYVYSLLIDYDSGDDARYQLNGYQVTELEMGGTPAVQSVIDNEEDKFTAIRAKQWVFEVFTSDNLGIADFVEGGDQRFMVIVESEAEGVVFLGWLSISDIRETFQPHPNTLVLTANDGLGFLNDTALVDFDGNNPQNENRILDYIAWCLAGTGLQLNIKACMNLRHGSGTRTASNVVFAAAGNIITVDFNIDFFYVGMPLTISDSVSNNMTTIVTEIISSTEVRVAGTLTDETATIYSVTFTDDSSNGHFYEKVYLDARTFEAEIGESEDKYTVLEKILGDMSYITQYKGEWVIMTPDETSATADYYFSTWFWNVLDPAIETYEAFTKQIGVGLPLDFMNDDAEVSAQRPYNIIKELFDLENWQEIICNIDFSRGITAISPPDLAAATSTGTYVADCWEVRNITLPTSSTIYIERYFEYGYEKERYLVITPQSHTTTPYDFAQSQPLNIQEKAKVNFSVDFRWQSDFGAGEGTVTYFPAMIYIIDENGDYWYWWNSDTPLQLETFRWEFRAQGDGEGNFYMPFSVNLDTTDESEWATISSSLSPAPANGQLFVCLINLHQDQDSGDNQNAFFANLSLEYIAFVNGNYGRYSAQQSSVTGTNSNVKALRENNVFISDGPDRNYKGVLLIQYGSGFQLGSFYYKWNLSQTPSIANRQPYGYWQAYGVWNQFNRVMRIFEGTVDGTESSTELPDLIHRYELTDADENTLNRYFQLLHFDMDMHLCEWSAFLIEVVRSDVEKEYTGLEFKYISGNE